MKKNTLTNIDYEIKRQKAIKKEPGCKFIRINPDENYDISIETGKIHNRIIESTKESTKKSLTDNI